MPKLFVSLLFVFVVFSSGVRAEGGVFNPHTFKLDNGMDVVVLPNHRAPVVLHMVWYKVGSAEEPEGKSGIAHLLEHLMFKGTPKHPNGEFSKRIAEFGGQENAFTSLDYTGYYQTVAADQLDMVMELEADRMTNLVLSSEDVITERNVVLEERNQRIETKPAARLREQSNKKFYPKGHPYGRPIIGWRHELESLTREDALAFYKQYYAPDNAILIVAGDVTVDQVKHLAKRHYGPIQPSGIKSRKSLLIGYDAEGGEAVLQDPRVKQASWSESYIQPSLTNGDPKRIVALEVLSDILGNNGTSRLYRALVINKPMAVSVGTYYDSAQRGDGRFVFYASPRPGVELDELSKAVYSVVNDLVSQGLNDGELARVKKRMQAEAVFSRDALKTGAWAIGGALAQGHTIDDVEKWPERIAAVTEQDVMDALKDLLAETRRTSTKLLPAAQGAAQ